eukprot:1151105-Pelagomonas_calceolata.AAC.2
MMLSSNRCARWSKHHNNLKLKGPNEWSNRCARRSKYHNSLKGPNKWSTLLLCCCWTCSHPIHGGKGIKENRHATSDKREQGTTREQSADQLTRKFKVQAGRDNFEQSKPDEAALTLCGRLSHYHMFDALRNLAGTT